MTASLNRRALAAGLLAAAAAPAAARDPHLTRTLRGDDTPRLPAYADLWARMPLPFTPAQAWRLLSPETQAEIGAAAIGMALAEYVSGQLHEDEADRFLDESLTSAAYDAQSEILNAFSPRLWTLFPDLYGPEGDHPRWALDNGMVHALGSGPERQPEPPAPAHAADPIFATISAADAARQAHQGIFDAGLDESDDAQMARLDTLRDADREAFAALATVIPTTRDGDVALADFYLRTLDDRDGQATACLRHLRGVLAGDLDDDPPLT
ncbi:hypothetical protein Q8W71_30045 [Methylobacterium sp. NEAU 140]|uniref:hypothetical protein n=1 Tax=Methylobacterium sp. NEAU 140 TaxID=3064945 RepID=UPI0027373A88|nr:hypothetical protein [Methylobacterium sp. NEAU 140]MDP4026843.1 hypothetical protein [Methylobacterium sp. NEAU 140]